MLCQYILRMRGLEATLSVVRMVQTDLLFVW